MNEVIHEVTVSAPAAALLELVADLSRSPLYMPSHLHAEVLERNDSHDLVERWAISGDTVRNWRVRRSVDEAAGTIVFEHEKPKPPLKSMRGEWSFRPAGEATVVRVSHSFDADGDATAARNTLADFDRNVPAVLDQVAELGPKIEKLRQYTITAERSGHVNAPIRDVYDHLVAGDTSDATKYARVCTPPNRIVHKWRAGLPADLHSLTGEYRLTETAEGVEVVVSNTIVMPSELDEAQVEGARKKLPVKSEMGLKAIIDHFSAVRTA
jgi:ribosome-associated toxin RatA of RatAB toxin-antitoxin module